MAKKKTEEDFELIDDVTSVEGLDPERFTR